MSAMPKAPGTKSWLNGQVLVSTGNRDLDGMCVWVDGWMDGWVNGISGWIA